MNCAFGHNRRRIRESLHFAAFKVLLKGSRMMTGPDLPIPMRALLAGARRKELALLDLTGNWFGRNRPRTIRLPWTPAFAGRDPRQGIGWAREKAPATRVWRRTRSALRATAGKVQVRLRFLRRFRSILLLGHLDTVWPLGTLKAMPCRLAEGRLWDPEHWI